MKPRTVLLAVVALLAGGCCASAQELLRIDPNPSKGFHWNYYLGIPATLKTPTVLLVEPNNTGTASDDQNLHDQKARDLASQRLSSGAPAALGSPVLVPAFPRPWYVVVPGGGQLYTHALDRDSLLVKGAGLERLDLQLIAMIEDAREKLAARGIQIQKRVWLLGFSASGSFVIRFTILHPEIVQAVSGSESIAPVAEWKGRRLRYPVGVADLPELTGQPFNVGAFRQVPMQVYVGDQDFNDAVAFRDGWEQEDADLVNDVFGGPPNFMRWPALEATYESVQASAQFVVFPGMGHSYADGAFINGFFERNRVWPPPPPAPKPVLHTIYFPHLACTDGLETQIVLFYPEEGGAVSGLLRGWKADSSAPVFSRLLSLPHGVRKTIDACRELPDPGNTGYLSFWSDSGFVSGFARFFRPGGDSASLLASKGNTAGVFPKREKLGSATLGFVNAESGPSGVRLLAYDDNGSEVARTTLTLAPNAKLTGSPQALFGRDPGNATWFRYLASGKTVGFLLHAAAGGLDVVPVLPEYMR
jgi:hypothetical protein